MAVLFFVDQPGLEICLAETHRLRVRCQRSWGEPQTKEITKGESPGLLNKKEPPMAILIVWTSLGLRFVS